MTTQFIEAKYLPDGMALKDPRNMTKQQLLDFAAHVQGRQLAWGVKQAFRFNQYYNGTEIVKAEYNDQQESAAVESLRAPTAREKSKSRQRKPRGPSANAAITADAVTTGNAVATVNAATSLNANHTSKTANAAANATQMPYGLENIDPALWEEQGADSRDAFPPKPQEPLTQRIDSTEMGILTNLGYPAVLPINGPNEGPPVYEVPVTALDLLHHHHGDDGRADQLQDPPAKIIRARGRPRKKTDIEAGRSPRPTEKAVGPRKKKATLNADGRAREEAAELINRSSNSRLRQRRR